MELKIRPAELDAFLQGGEGMTLECHFLLAQAQRHSGFPQGGQTLVS